MVVQKFHYRHYLQITIFLKPYGRCSVFITEFAEFINNVYVLVMSDFNIHWDVDANTDRTAFYDLITSCGLQYVKSVTYDSGHTLNLILAKEEFPFPLSDPQNVFPISDHRFIKFWNNITNPPPVKQVVE